MHRQPRFEAMDASAFFDDGAATRPLVPGTVPRSGPIETYAALGDVASPRPPLTVALLERGQQRFNIYCSVCHGRGGYGNGIVVRRGFPQAASYHTEALRAVDDAHIFAVITAGHKNMPAYGPLIRPNDRWAIVAYVRALQLSQNARIEDVPEESRVGLE